jgi:hypothetical protein
MVKVININYCLKDSFKSIRRWRRMDEDDFSNKIIVILNSSKSVNEKFSVKGSTLELEYVALNNFISYSSTSSIYDVDLETLLKVAKDNGFMTLELSSDFNFKDELVVLVKKLVDLDLEVIPLEDRLLVKSDEELMINFRNRKLHIKNIE